MVANTSYLPANVTNLLAATLGEQLGANDYRNRVFPAQVGLSKRPVKVVNTIINIDDLIQVTHIKFII